jgi:8-oxo-dGTP pyrophosphatase MutT (NUDIX family)
MLIEMKKPETGANHEITKKIIENGITKTIIEEGSKENPLEIYKNGLAVIYRKKIFPKLREEKNGFWFDHDWCFVTEELWDGKKITVRSYLQIGERESEKEAASLAVVIDKKSGDFIFVRTFNQASNSMVLDLPGGVVEMEDADSLAAATRELSEELGVSVSVEDIYLLIEKCQPYYLAAEEAQYLCIPVDKKVDFDHRNEDEAEMILGIVRLPWVVVLKVMAGELKLEEPFSASARIAIGPLLALAILEGRENDSDKDEAFSLIALERMERQSKQSN